MVKKKQKSPVNKPVAAENELTPKEQLFVDGYLGASAFNATEAMRQAGYKGSAGVLGVSGHRLLRKPKVAAIILERLNEHAMSANEVLAILSKQARGSLDGVLDEEGVLDVEALRKLGSNHLLKKLSVKPAPFGTAYAFEIHDPQAAAVHLGKYHRLFTEKVEHSFDLSTLSDKELEALEPVLAKLARP